MTIKRSRMYLFQFPIPFHELFFLQNIGSPVKLFHLLEDSIAVVPFIGTLSNVVVSCLRPVSRELVSVEKARELLSCSW